MKDDRESSNESLLRFIGNSDGKKLSIGVTFWQRRSDLYKDMFVVVNVTFSSKSLLTALQSSMNIRIQGSVVYLTEIKVVTGDAFVAKSFDFASAVITNNSSVCYLHILIPQFLNLWYFCRTVVENLHKANRGSYLEVSLASDAASSEEEDVLRNEIRRNKQQNRSLSKDKEYIIIPYLQKQVMFLMNCLTSEKET